MITFDCQCAERCGTHLSIVLHPVESHKDGLVAKFVLRCPYEKKNHEIFLQREQIYELRSHLRRIMTEIDDGLADMNKGVEPQHSARLARGRH